MISNTTIEKHVGKLSFAMMCCPLPWNNCPALPAGSGPHLDHCTWKKTSSYNSTFLIAPVFRIKIRLYYLGFGSGSGSRHTAKALYRKFEMKLHGRTVSFLGIHKSDLVCCAGKKCPQKTLKFHVLKCEQKFLRGLETFFSNLELLHVDLSKYIAIFYIKKQSELNLPRDFFWYFWSSNTWICTRI